ncbi:hypothetical protein B0H11DRAFT_2317231 [Mycena galericulata]|nr:hypothetical protein B0H11DRAFT_2317231 [Mycena galericulata]
MDPGGVLVPEIDNVVFLHNSSGDGEQSRDVMVTWQVRMEGNTAAQATQIQDKIIGPEEECGPDKPVEQMVAGQLKLVSGFKIKRNWHTLNLEGAPHTYPIATSVQVPKGKMQAPAVGNKFYGVEDEGLVLRKEILQFTGDVSMSALEEGPPGLTDLLHDQGEIMNVPPIGSSCNHCFTGVQINITHPNGISTVIVDEKKSITDLGIFGHPHLDKGDEDTGMTAAS